MKHLELIKRVNTMENNVDWLQLPVEVWLNIFEYLNLHTFLKTTEVCHTFSSIIGTSNKLINKIRLSINFNVKKTDDFVRILQSSQRQYTVISMKNSSESNKELEAIQVMNKFENSLKELSLEEYKGSPEASTCRFPNLKKLTLLSCDKQWMNYFANCNQLTFLNVKNRLRYTLEDEYFANFLMKQKCLKELVISGEINQLIKKGISYELPFKLNKLSINGDISFTDLQTSLQFFETQNQLSEVKIRDVWWFAIENKKIFNEIFLKSSQLKAVEFTSELTFLSSYTNFLNGDFTHYGVEKLSFKYIHYTMLFYILNRLFVVLAQLFPNVKYFNLKELNDLPIAHISCQCIYDVFPLIESLTISQMANVNATVKVFCQKLTKLKSLKMSKTNYEQISAKTKVECQRAGVSISY